MGGILISERLDEESMAKRAQVTDDEPQTNNRGGEIQTRSAASRREKILATVSAMSLVAAMAIGGVTYGLYIQVVQLNEVVEGLDVEGLSSELEQLSELGELNKDSIEIIANGLDEVDRMRIAGDAELGMSVIKLSQCVNNMAVSLIFDSYVTRC